MENTTVKILDILRNSNGYISGAQISECLNISRSAVWKSITALKKCGYTIDAVTNKGYILKNTPDTLCEFELKSLLGGLKIGNPLYLYDTVTSTFDKLAEKNIAEGTLVAARKQLNGRGRLGRNWTSSYGGVYMSFMLTPKTECDDIPFITVICALGTVNALKKYGDCKIKWPNDIVLNGKKICGILTTANICFENVECVNVGIGINANIKPDSSSLPYATSVANECGYKINENYLLFEVIKSINELYYQNDREKICNDYKNNCITLGRDVRLNYAKDGKTVTGKCIDITDNGSLTVECSDGRIITVNGGEVSVRGLYGYV